MDTLLTTSPTKAAAVLRSGDLVAFPTETVYGLGADVFQPEAVRSIFQAKGRPSDNPLIVHIHDRSQLDGLVSHVPSVAQTLLDAYVPGPLTVILPKHSGVPSVVTAGLETVGVRMPVHPIARNFLEACATPVAAPSANRSGRPSPTTWEAVEEDLGGRIACILQGGRTDAGVESTVVDCTTVPPTLLRPGAISLESLEGVVGNVVESSSEETAARSPGTRHRHYAPAARVRLVASPAEATPQPSAGYIGVDRPTDPDPFAVVRVVPDIETYAHELFHFFRTCDEAGCAVIYAQTVSPDELGRTVNDRLKRAAAR